MEVGSVAFTLSNVVVDPVVILITVNALRGVTFGTADGTLDAGVFVLGIVMNAPTFLADFVMLPEVSGVTSFTDVKRFTFKATVDGTNLADIVGIGEVLVNTVALVVLELSVDASLTGLTMLGISALNAVLDSVVASLASAVLVQVLISVNTLTDSIL